jgi:hypothetical protein
MTAPAEQFPSWEIAIRPAGLDIITRAVAFAGRAEHPVHRRHDRESAAGSAAPARREGRRARNAAAPLGPVMTGFMPYLRLLTRAVVDRGISAVLLDPVRTFAGRISKRSSAGMCIPFSGTDIGGCTRRA